MTSPNGEMAGDGYRVGGTGVRALTDLNNLSESEAKRRLRAPVEPSFNRHRDSVWGTFNAVAASVANVFNTFFGKFFTSPVTVVEVVDGQLEIQNRLDLMEQVSGYATAYCPENYMQGGGSTFLTVRFKARLGPHKNAVVNGDGTISVAKGTWMVYCLVTTDTNTNSPTGFLRIEVLRPDGSEYSIKEVQQNIEGGKWNSFHAVHSVVVPGPGYKVRARFRYSPAQVLKTLIRGGTHLSHLTVQRMDLSAKSEQVDESVPTGPDIN